MNTTQFILRSKNHTFTNKLLEIAINKKRKYEILTHIIENNDCLIDQNILNLCLQYNKRIYNKIYKLYQNQCKIIQIYNKINNIIEL